MLGPELYIIKDEKGRGVYCREKLTKGSLIELCQVILLSSEDTQKIHKTRIHDYYFVWDISAGTSAIALGNGSLYNHSDNPNAEFELDIEFQLIKFTAIKDIEPGEEILVSYINKTEKDFELWFEPKS